MKNPVSTKRSKQVVNPVLISNTDVFKKVGNEVVLSPGPVTNIITIIVWKHGSNIAVEWFGGNVKYFKDRCTLNVTAGELTISGLTLEDSGSYTPEINNRVLNPTEILVISGVPTPTVSKSCDAEKSHCVLTCEGITTDAEPVVYSWWSGDVMKSKTEELKITEEEKDCWFICMLENPVSSESSKVVLNPFITPPDPGNNNLYWLLTLLLVPMVAVSVCCNVGAIVVFMYVYRTGKYPPQLRRVRSRFETFPCWRMLCPPADAPQASSNPVPEMRALISGVQAPSPQDQRTDVSTGIINEPETTSEKPENQRPPAKPQRSSSSDNVTPLKDQKTDESTKTNNDPGTSSEKPVVDESPADPEKTPGTPNSEALNPNMEEKQANEN